MKPAPIKRKKGLRSKSKKSRSRLNKELDDMAKRCAKVRDRWICQKCGKHVEGSDAHGSHVIPVSRGNALRWDLQNIKTLCYNCHLHWWHKNPVESGEWFKAKFPERWEYLEPRAHEDTKFSMSGLEELKEDMARELKRLGG